MEVPKNPQNHRFMMENPIQMDDLGYPHFRKPLYYKDPIYPSLSANSTFHPRCASCGGFGLLPALTFPNFCCLPKAWKKPSGSSSRLNPSNTWRHALPGFCAQSLSRDQPFPLPWNVGAIGMGQMGIAQGVRCVLFPSILVTWPQIQNLTLIPD